MSNMATNMGRVLVFGAETDKASQMLVNQCRDAGCFVHWHKDDQVYDFSLKDPVDVIVYNYPAHFLQDQVFAQSLTKRHTVILLQSWSDWALGKGLEEHASQVMGFSPMALYADKPVLELSRTLNTSDITIDLAQTFLGNMGFETFVIKETPGFILPRTVAMLVNEATSALMEGVATVEDIDTAMKLGTNYPIGPFAWADAVGLDVILEILEFCFHQYGEDRYRPMHLLHQKVLAGQLGEKTGKGFYDYAEKPSLVAMAVAEASARPMDLSLLKDPSEAEHPVIQERLQAQAQSQVAPE
jgi:hypothetical protein